MPECGIGFFVDVGSAYFLSHLPGELGTYLALTGQRLKGIALKEAGLATHYVPSHLLSDLEDAIADLGAQSSSRTAVHRLLTEFEAKVQLPKQSETLLYLPDINAVFGLDNVEAIYEALQKRNDEWAQQTLKLLKGGSPTSQKISFRHVREGQHGSLADTLRRDFRIVWHMCHHSTEFIEGIRAKLIDKDNNARWNPPTVQEVSDAEVDEYFKPLPEHLELKLPTDSQPLPRARL
jgi:3-hydroxyisobutyryl-CoA hydrolase